MIEEIVHVGVGVFDLKKAVKFYTEVMGMEIDYWAHNEGEKVAKIVDVKNAKFDVCVVRKGNVRLELLDYGVAENKTKVEYKDQSTPGLLHIAMKVDNVDEEYKKLKALGYDFTTEPMVARENGPKICYFHGPDNVVMELFEVPKK